MPEPQPQPKGARVPPQALEAEESVLGAIMLAPRVIADVAAELRPDDFYRESHGRIYAALLQLDAAGEPTDVITLTSKLIELGCLDEVGGRPRLHELAATVPAVSNAAHHARLVREAADLRGLIRVGLAIGELGWEQAGAVPELLEEAERAVFALARPHGRGLQSVQQPVSEAYDHINKLYEGGAGPQGLQLGFADLDRLVSGILPGNLVILAARPSLGKTAFALGAAANLTLRQGVPAALFTLEMSTQEIVLRLLAAEAGIEPQKLRNGDVRPERWSHLLDASSRLAQAPLYVEDQGLLTMNVVRAETRRLKARQPGLALVIVDYLQLMASSGQRENRVQEVSQITREMKMLARELDVVVLALSQLSRAPEQRHDHRPILADLRDSGSIEQDADLVLFLYRDDYYFEDTEHPGVAEVNVAKHRNGPTGHVRLAFVRRFARFNDLAPEHAQAAAPPPPAEEGAP